jgi:hypothetical protein
MSVRPLRGGYEAWLDGAKQAKPQSIAEQRAL